MKEVWVGWGGVYSREPLLPLWLAIHFKFWAITAMKRYGEMKEAERRTVQKHDRPMDREWQGTKPGRGSQ